jgi:uncharacterized protein YbjT (DUF2867 family)
MILVTGATGHVGSELVAQLVSRQETGPAGVPPVARSIRAMTRRPQATTLPSTVEVVYGDADDPASLDLAFAGVDAAFLMSAQPVGSAPRERIGGELTVDSSPTGSTTVRVVLPYHP